MTRLDVLRVFIGPDGGGGNPLGVLLDGGSIPEARRQAVAAELGFSETVFVEAIDPPQRAATWEDEAAGRLRSRYFATDVGILEDEATGAAAVVTGDRLGRDLVIRQGVGSEILVRPDRAAGTVDIGGSVERVETRMHPDAGIGG